MIQKGNFQAAHVPKIYQQNFIVKILTEPPENYRKILDSFRKGGENIIEKT